MTSTKSAKYSLRTHVISSIPAGPAAENVAIREEKPWMSLSKTAAEVIRASGVQIGTQLARRIVTNLGR
jgi:hypothetical protein